MTATVVARIRPRVDPPRLARAYGALTAAGIEVGGQPVPVGPLCRLLERLGVRPIDVAMAASLLGLRAVEVGARVALPLGGLAYIERLRGVVAGRVAGRPVRWQRTAVVERVLGRWHTRTTWRRSIVKPYGSFQSNSGGGNGRPRSSASTRLVQGPSTPPPEVFE